MSGINIGFLCSGKQFRAAEEAQSKEPVASSKDTQPKNLRLEEFYAKTLEAFLTSGGERSNAAPGIDVDVLRSGRQFTSPPESQFVTTTSPKTHNARLHEFHDRMLTACQPVEKEPSSGQGAASVGINIDALRSGRQFVSAPESKFTASENKSHHRRLEDFHSKTLRAHQESQPPVVSINVDFLRSGMQFVSPPESQFTPSEHIGRHARLELFHNMTLTALQTYDHAEATESAVGLDRSGQQFVSPPESQFTPSESKGHHTHIKDFHKQTLLAHAAPYNHAEAPAVGLNVDALRSGQQFVSPRESQFTPSESKGHHARLEDFYKQTLLTHAHDHAEATESPVGLNVDALRSGQQFVSPPESQFTPSESKGHHARLEDFHKQTLLPHQDKLNEPMLDGKENENEVMPINLDFIRSGQEFQGATAASPEAKRWEGFKTKGKHARLEKFHDDMLKAFSKSKTAGSKPSQVPKGINLDFIRSGQEFSASNAASPEARQWEEFQAHSKHSRLERFHNRMLSAYNQNARAL